MSIFLMTLAVLFQTSSAKADISDLKEQLQPSQVKANLDPDQIKAKLDKQIAQLHVKGSAKLFDLDQIDGLDLSARYHYEAEPSYQNSFYTRTDEWTLSTDINPGEALSLDLTPISFHIGQSTVVSFSRQFPNQQKALVALPYALEHLPFNADRAISKLAPGDFVSFHANLNLLLGAGFSQVYGFVAANEETHFVVSGDFEVRVYRRANDVIRLQLIATQSHGGGASVGLGSAEALKVTGLKLVDKQILRKVHTDPFSVFGEKRKNGLFMVDYVLDLKKKEVRDAYNDVLSSSFEFKNLQILEPLRSVGSVTHTLVSNIAEIEDLFQQDKCKSDGQRRVRRVKKGRLIADQSTSGIKVGLNIFRIEGNTTYTQNAITLLSGADEKPENYLLDSWQKDDSTKVVPLLGLSESRKILSMNGLVKADDEFRPTEFSDLGLFSDRRENPFTENEQGGAKEHLQNLLPAEIYKRIPWGEWDVKGERRAAHLIHQVFFHPAALKELEGIGKDVLREKFVKYVESLPKLHSQPKIYAEPMTQLYTGQGSNDIDWTLKFKSDIGRIVDSLHNVFQKGLAPMERLEGLRTITPIPLFEEVGAGYLISLMDPKKLGESIHFSMLWTANGTPDLRYHWPEDQDVEKSQHSKLYTAILSMQSKLYDRGIDLRKDDFADDSDSCPAGNK